MKIVTKFTYNHNEYKYHPVGPSCTVPDESYTIKEIIQRYNAGCAPDVHQYNEYDINPVRNGTVDDLFRDVEMVDPRLEPDFDLVDRVAAAEAAKANIKRLLSVRQEGSRNVEQQEEQQQAEEQAQ